MSEIVLATKLHIPTLRPSLVARPGLLQMLNAGLAGKLIIISAPAGFGKTTLITEWIHSSQFPIQNLKFAWLTLDEGDNDPVRFVTYLIAALGRCQPAASRLKIEALRPAQPASVEAAMKMLINEIAALPGEFVLVLDDYHLINAPSVHKALDFLLNHLPPNLRLLIATRIDPPFSTARLRGRAQVMELRQGDLSFTPQEAAAFLNEVMGLKLATADANALASRTEGWIAGLQMAAVSMQGRHDLPAFVRAYAGSNRYILDYLVEEVFQRQPEDVKTFLLNTAVLERLTAPLCQYLLSDFGLEPSGHREPEKEIQRVRELLEYLERTNLFIIPLDEEREWYRYHRLFSDLLRKRLGQLQPHKVRVLHSRASNWFEQNLFEDDAIRHAFLAEDLDRSADLVERNGEAALKRSESVTLLNWLNALPDGLIRARPLLSVFYAWAMLLNGRPMAQVESRLQEALAAYEEQTSPAIPGNVAAIRSRISMLGGQIAQAVDFSRLALEVLPQENAFFRGIALWDLGMASLVDGDTAAGSRILEEAARTSREAGNILVAVTTLCRLAGLNMLQGRLHQARDIYQQALELATRDHGRLPVAGEALLGLGELAREWNDLEAATRYIEDGIQLSNLHSEISALAGFLSLARVKQAQGDSDGALEMIRRARKVAVEFSATKLDDRTVALAQAQIWIRGGNIAAVEQWARELGLDSFAAAAELLEPTIEEERFKPEQHLYKYELLMLARLWIAQTRFSEALSLLDPLLQLAEGRRRKKTVLEILTLKALVFQAQGKHVQGTAMLEQAVNLAEAAGYARVFLDEGPPLEALLRRVASHNVAPAYARKLLAAFAAPMVEPRLTAQSLADPLSERELQVLRLLATNASGPEIADELMIAISTFRSHTKSIYGKLDVNRRSDAVSRAGQLGLI